MRLSGGQQGRGVRGGWLEAHEVRGRRRSLVSDDDLLVEEVSRSTVTSELRALLPGDLVGPDTADWGRRTERDVKGRFASAYAKETHLQTVSDAGVQFDISTQALLAHSEG